MNVLVCVKRVPMVGSRINLSLDGLSVDTRQLGFTISPHEECAVEEAVRIVEARGGVVSVLTLGPPEAVEQLRDAAAIGASRLIHLVTDEREWDPMATADALVEEIRTVEAAQGVFDLILLGNEAPDTGDYQVGVRVAHALGRPAVTGVKALVVGDGTLQARREFRGGDETFEMTMPCVVSVKEGINLPRYPSLPGRIRAKKVAVEEASPPWHAGPVRVVKLHTPVVERSRAEILGTGVDAVPALVDLLEKLGVLT
ncbi:MAG TPA: electron transfer flavoprotein subunit beta/FixA family protein [Acidimicrobiales bacterium]|nr:electron transfer flavoprotein subunit beta/FixA family protein [Acidimicrobiales bacterium]